MDNHLKNTHPYEEVLQLMRMPPGERDENRIAELVMPLAKQIAESEAWRFRGSSARPFLDDDACLSNAMKAVNNVIKRTHCNADVDAASLEYYFKVAIRTSLASLKKSTLGPNGKKIQPYPLQDGKIENGIVNAEQPFSYANLVSQNYSVAKRQLEVEDLKQHLLLQFEKRLSPSQYRVMAALLDDKYNGDRKEMARALGLKESSFGSTLDQARKRLRTHDPKLESELRELLGSRNHIDGIRIYF